jgi:hypothetical protein
MQQEARITTEVHCEKIKNCVSNSEEKEWNADIRCSAPP